MQCGEVVCCRGNARDRLHHNVLMVPGVHRKCELITCSKETIHYRSGPHQLVLGHRRLLRKIHENAHLFVVPVLQRSGTCHEKDDMRLLALSHCAARHFDLPCRSGFYLDWFI